MNVFQSQMLNDINLHKSIKTNQGDKPMYNQTHLENMKEEMANTEQKNRELMAHCIRLTNHLKNSDGSERWSDESDKIIEQSPKVSLEEYKNQVIELFKQSFSKAE